jgi:hypothetical protein
VAAADVNYGEPAEAEADWSRDEIAVIIWATVGNSVGHALDESRRNLLGRVKY